MDPLPTKAIRHHRNRKLTALFDAALGVAPGDRAAFLDQACGRDLALRQQLDRLLAAAEAPTRGHLEPGFGLGLAAADDGDTVVTPAFGLGPPPPEDGSDPQAGLPAGAHIQHYEIIRPLGRGGMGAVYLARDTKLGRRVAIKVLHGDQPGFTQRFIVEAQTTARCHHENIVVIHDVDEHAGNPFMVLEYLRGQTLGALIARGPMPAGRALQLVVPVVRALACAHRSQIIHRDLKPDNIFITATGTVKVLDFGIAKFIHEKQIPSVVERVAATVETLPQHPQLTRHGAIIGTLPYMSPEQWRAQRLDFRSDLWAVGVILYQMVVGKHPLHPLRGEQLMVTAIVDQPMPSARDVATDVPAALADIIDSCLEKRREHRMPSAERLLTALESLLPGHHDARIAGDDSPYAGLEAFQEADAGRFFGRSRDIATLIARLHDEPLIGVVGPSGVGKSSFIRAGVIPAVKVSGETWESFVIRPGRQPLPALARMVATILGDESDEATWHAEDMWHHHEILRRLATEPGYLGTVLRGRARKHGTKILLFVDQFEELYTLTPDLAERLAFTTALTGVADDASSPLRVVLSIRSDFLDRVAEDRAFMAELNKALYFLVQPDRDGLREAIIRPAEMAGYTFEAPWIVDHMLDSLQTATGALPLLQFTAAKLWEARNTAQKLLTERSYRELGGIEGALASHANAVLASFSPQEQTLVRAIFLQLVTLERTRAIASVGELRELCPDPSVVQRLVDQLVQDRLLVVQTGDHITGSLVEIVHESLIRSWPTLSHWLDENQEDAPYLEQLKTAARQWDGRGRPRGLLWRGDAAREAESWYLRYRGFLPRLQKEYIVATSPSWQPWLRM